MSPLNKYDVINCLKYLAARLSGQTPALPLSDTRTHTGRFYEIIVRGIRPPTGLSGWVKGKEL